MVQNYQIFFKIVQLLTFAIIFSVLVSCNGGGNGSTSPSTLSSDQQIYERAELNGGTFSLSWNIPYGGGTLLTGTNYMYSVSTGGLLQSPIVAGPQQEAPVLTSLVSSLTIPTTSTTRHLLAGKVFVRSTTALRRVSYVGSNVVIDYLADDAQTVVQRNRFYNFSETPLSGIISNNVPTELNVNTPILYWISANNFSATAQWHSGAFYNKRHGSVVGDTYIAQDCTNKLPLVSTTTVAMTPCTAGGTLDNFFPVTLYSSDGHPQEIDLATDGSIKSIESVRMWVAHSPLPGSVPQSYRVYYELNGNIYMGILERDGTPFRYRQADGSVVDYSIGLNQAAVNSIQQGLLAGAVVAGSQAGSAAAVPTVDLYGIGGHGINGSLAPVDLRLQYGIPDNLTGTGQTIAIVAGSGTGDDVIDDLNVFSQYYNLPQCNTANSYFQHIDLSGGLNAGAIETALDTQMVHAIAPNAKIILVTAASQSVNDLFKAIIYAAGLPGVTAVSISFGGYSSVQQADIQNFDSQLSGFQSQGLVFFASSGDYGNYNYNINHYYPAESPYVTAVGGTHIKSVPWISAQSEVAWEFSGGGFSSHEIMPTWQSSYLSRIGWSIPIGSGMRLLPDVSAVADVHYSPTAIYYKQQWSTGGGTSLSAPIWAGICALFGEYLSNKGQSLATLVKSTPGGFNGLLYQTKVTQGANAGFHDIVSGTNRPTDNTCSVCTAKVGYDGVTGLGVPNVTNLFSLF